MSARPPRPVPEVRHRLLAWDKPQFLVENTSRRPDHNSDLVPRGSGQERSRRRDIRLSVSRSSDRQQQTSNRRSDGLTNPVPVLIGDLWKPMQIRSGKQDAASEFDKHAAVGEQRDGASRSTVLPLRLTAYDTRREAQRIIQSPSSAVYQFLRGRQGDRDPGMKSASLFLREHVNKETPTKTGEVAGYTLFGGNQLPSKTSVYNLNEHIVSSARDLSSLSFGSIGDMEASSNKPGTPNTRRSRSNHTCGGSQAELRNRGQSVDSVAHGDHGSHATERVTGPSPSDGSTSMPSSLDEISLVSKENGGEVPAARDCSTCPMCRALAALHQGIPPWLHAEGTVTTDSAKISEALLRNPHTALNDDEKTTKPLSNDQKPSNDVIRLTPTKTKNFGEIGSVQMTLGSNFTVPLSETSLGQTSPDNDTIDSYSKECSTTVRSPNMTQEHSVYEPVLRSDIRTSPRPGKSARSRPLVKKRAESLPRTQKGPIVIRGSGLSRVDKLQEFYGEGSLSAATWGQLTDPRATHQAGGPRHGSVGGSLGAVPPTAVNRRVPLIIWRKMQQRESLIPPIQAGPVPPIHTGPGRVGFPGQHGGDPARFTRHQEQFVGRVDARDNGLVVYIPTAEFATEEEDCPPNSPIQE